MNEAIRGAGLSEIALTDVDIDDMTYAVWAWSDYGKIKESIAQTGLLNPAIVAKKSNGFAIVSGHKRIRALIELGWAKVHCLLVEPEDPPYQLFINTVMENLSFREYNLIEKSLILNQLEVVTSCGYSIEKLRQTLGIHACNLAKIKDLQSLPREALRAIACGKVRPSVALEFAEFGPEDQLELIKALEMFDLGENKQREILLLIFELARIQHCTPAEILRLNEIRKVLVDPVLNAPQKGALFLDILRAKRSPTLSGMQREFETAKRRTSPPRNVAIINKAPFEADSLQLSISLSNRTELACAYQYLKNLEAREEFESLLRAATGTSVRKSE